MSAPTLRLAALSSLTGICIFSCSDGGRHASKVTITGLQTIQFESRNDIKVGSFATNVTTGDLDGDGRADLLVSRYQDSKLTLVRGLGGGNYAAPVELPMGPLFPIGTALGDADQDGRLDVIAADFENGQFYLYKNLGGGAFTTPTATPTSVGVVGIAAADFDIDGTLDVAVGSIITDEIRIHRGLGALGFEDGSTFVAGGLPVQLYTTDVDSDGRPDVICSDIMTARLRLLRNVPSSSNSAQVELQDYVNTDTAPALLGLAIGDLDGDQQPEYITSSAAIPSIVVWRLAGGLLTPIATVPNPCITGAIQLADFDGDGKLDLAAACPAGNGVEIWKGLGGGLFDSPIFRATGRGPVFLAANDTTGDGVADLHVAAALSGEVTIFSGRPGSTTNIVDGTAAIFVGGQPILGAAGDLDGDNLNDLAIGDNEHPIVNILRNKDNLQFEAMGALPVHAEASAYKPLLFDFNNDGDLDIAALSDGGVTFFSNSGIGEFTETGHVDAAGALLLGVVLDWNHDGRREFAATASSAGSVAIFINQNGTLALDRTVASGLSPLGIDAADFDRDGDLDIASANNGDNTIRLLKHTQTGVSPIATPLETLSGPAYVYARDYNHNGRPDLAVSHVGADDILVFNNRGSFQFAEPTSIPTGGRATAMLFEDINKDGRFDLLYNENTTGRIAVRLAGADGLFAAPMITFAGQYEVSCPILSDLDGDDLPELLTISSLSGLIEIHKNRSH